MGIVVTDGYTCHHDTQLKLHNGSVTFSDDPHTPVYHLRPSGHDVLLLNAHGNSLLLTLRPKTVTTRGRWEAYAGGSKRIFSVRRSNLIGPSGFTAEVYKNPIAERFEIEGSFKQRRFTVYDSGRSRSVMADIEVVSHGVFRLTVKAGSDTAFSVALAFLIGKIDGDAA